MMLLLCLFLQNIYAFNGETAKILQVSQLNKSPIVFTLNVGKDRSIQYGDWASFYTTVSQPKNSKNSKKPSAYKFLGRAKVIQIFPYKSLWQVHTWPRKRKLKKNSLLSFYHLANYEEMKAKAQIKRNVQVLLHTRPEFLDPNKRYVPEVTPGKLEKSPITYKDPEGKDLQAIYIKQLQKGKSEEEILDELTKKEHTAYFDHHLSKRNQDYFENPPVPHLLPVPKSQVPSDEFSDDVLRKLLLRHGEMKESKRKAYLSTLWVDTQIQGTYQINTASINNYRSSTLQFALEFPLGAIHLDAIKWTVSSSYRHHWNTLVIFDTDFAQIEEKTLFLGAHYYIWNSMALLRKFSWSVGLGLRWGGGLMKNLTYPSSNTYAATSLPTFTSSLKFRIHRRVGLSIDFSLDQMKYSLQEARAEYHMPVNLRQTQLQIGGGLCAYF